MKKHRTAGMKIILAVILLGVSILLIMLFFYIPDGTVLIYHNLYRYFNAAPLVLGCVVMVPVIVLLRGRFPLESILWINIVLFAGAGIFYPTNWWLWIFVIPLGFIYLKNIEKTSGHKGAVIAFMALSAVCLTSFVLFSIVNGDRLLS